jgi:hypothetical protein
MQAITSAYDLCDAVGIRLKYGVAGGTFDGGDRRSRFLPQLGTGRFS